MSGGNSTNKTWVARQAHRLTSSGVQRSSRQASRTIQLEPEIPPHLMYVGSRLSITVSSWRGRAQQVPAELFDLHPGVLFVGLARRLALSPKSIRINLTHVRYCIYTGFRQILLGREAIRLCEDVRRAGADVV